MTLGHTPQKARMTRTNSIRVKCNEIFFHLLSPTAASEDQGKKQPLNQQISNALQSVELYATLSG